MRRRVLPWLAVVSLACACGDDESGAESTPDAAAAEPDAGVDGAVPVPALDAAARPLFDASPSIDAGFVDEPDADDLAADAAPRDASSLPYVQTVVSFKEGAGAGFGRERYPEIIFGPPRGKGSGAGSLDVLSLGVGGELVVDLGARAVVDGPGADFIVFENPFWPGGDPNSVFAELGEISVSDDLRVWSTFPCDARGAGGGRFPGCAGFTPTLVYDPFVVVPLDPAITGGDAFDLAQLGLKRARYVRIRDLAASGEGDTGGFDLDAVGVIHPGT